MQKAAPQVEWSGVNGLIENVRAVKDADEVLRNWARIKAEERKDRADALRITRRPCQCLHRAKAAAHNCGELSYPR